MSQTKAQLIAGASDQDVIFDDATVNSLNGGPLAGMRNLLINGNPIINQRGYVSGTATSGANEYTLDRWRVVTSGQSITFTDSANVRTVTAPAGGIEQVIEGINIFSGTYVLNWTGTATATVNGTSVAKGGTVTLTGGTNCTVRFSGGTFSLPQLEPGTVATPFERRSYGQELSLCQRYYEKSYDTETAPGTNTTTGCWCSVNINAAAFYDFGRCQFRVTKRTNPTIAMWSTDGTFGVFFNTTAGSNSGNSGSRFVGQNGCSFFSSNSAMSPSNAAVYTHWSATSEL